MSPRDEVAIERYVRYPHTLSVLERATVARLLRADPVAREVAAFFRSFYDDFDALADEEPDDVWLLGPDPARGS